jgi:uncharacterized SAM-binding protein YcdF (DUF218 family)
MDILFLIKKLVVALVSPISIVLILGALSFFLLMKGHKKTGMTGWGLSLLLLWGFSFNPVGNSLMLPHESQYSAFKHDEGIDVTVIHVLGGGHIESSRFPNDAQLSSSSLARVIEGLRIALLYPDARIVFSGYSGYSGINTLPNAEVARNLAVSLGVDPERIDLLTEAKDTREEAIDVADMIGDGKLVLVTSASHLPRAMKIFHQEGIYPLPAPAFFLATEKATVFYPTYTAIQKSERFIYEQFGLAWIQLKAWLSE